MMNLSLPYTLHSVLSDNGFVETRTPVDLPELPGIYVICGCQSELFEIREATCLYVGQSRNLRIRLLAGHDKWKQVCKQYKTRRIYYRAIDSREYSSIAQELVFQECLLIGLLRPVLNGSAPVRVSTRKDADTIKAEDRVLIYVEGRESPIDITEFFEPA